MNFATQKMNLFYIDIKEGRRIKKYILDEYVEMIKKKQIFLEFY